jgi:hypothetical protein
MKTIQEQLAERIYEILPHKKELEFGCEILDRKDNLIKKIAGSNGDEKVLIKGIGEIEKFKLLDICDFKIIGQPIRLADLLHAMYKSEDKNESKWSYIAGVAGDKLYFDAPSNNKAIVYNISQDNILSQSDEFCEWALQILK